MKRLRTTLALTVILVPLIAVNVFAHGGSDSSGSDSSSSMMGDDSMMGPGMMEDGSEEQWNRFNQSFRDMDRLMERIYESDDSDEHYRLMHDHMHELQNGMMMMGEGWRMGSPDNDRDPDDWDGRMRNIERQMFLMQKMLNQMIEREAAKYEDDEE